MSAGYSTPCTGELQFWSVMRAQMVEQTKQLTRIADTLEKWVGAQLEQPAQTRQYELTTRWVEPVEPDEPAEPQEPAPTGGGEA